MRTARIKAAVLGVGPLVVLMGALSQGSGDCGEGNASGVVPSCTPTPGATTTTTPGGAGTTTSTGTATATSTATPTSTSTVAVMGNGAVSLANGLRVSTSAPRSFTPTDTAAGVVAGAKYIVFDVVIFNNTANVVSLPSTTITVDSTAGPAEQIFDSAQDIGGTSNLGEIAEFWSAGARVAFSVPASATSITVAVQPLVDGETAFLTGSV